MTKKIDRMGVKTGRTLNENDEVVNIADLMSAGKAVNADSITPNDNEDIDVSEGIYVGTGGDLAVTFANMEAGTSIVLAGLQEGVIHPLKVKRVWATDTTAENIVAIY